MENLIRYKLEKLDNNTVIISGNEFEFIYTIADSVVKEEFKGKYEYIGGLQCNYKSDSKEFLELEDKLKQITRKILI
jgi:hypothetical protein